MAPRFLGRRHLEVGREVPTAGGEAAARAFPKAVRRRTRLQTIQIGFPRTSLRRAFVGGRLELSVAEFGSYEKPIAERAAEKAKASNNAARAESAPAARRRRFFQAP